MTLYDMIADPRLLGSQLAALFVKSMTRVLKENDQLISERNDKRLILYIKGMQSRLQRFHEMQQKKVNKKRGGGGGGGGGGFKTPIKRGKKGKRGSTPKQRADEG